MNEEIGKTKDAGYQIGARKTVDADHAEVWEFVFSDEGLKTWLGEINCEELELGKEAAFTDGTKIKITVFKPFSHTRMTWKKKNWKNQSRLQLRIIRSKQKAVIAFHQEKLADSKQREEMKIHWNEVLRKLSAKLEENPKK